MKKFCVVLYIVADKNKLISRNVYNDIHFVHIPFGELIVGRLYIRCDKEPKCFQVILTTIHKVGKNYEDVVIFYSESGPTNRYVVVFPGV